MNENILKSLDSAEKENLQEGLKSLIEQTYVIENEYKALQASYESLRKMMSEIIEVLPTALWVLEGKTIILQNEQALKNEALLAHIDTSKAHYELEYEGRFFIIKNISHEGRLIIQATDISDEKRNERLASMGSVAAHLAHEIRNPIGSISLLASTLFSRTELKNKHIVLEIQKATSRVERIVNSTLLFTKGVRINSGDFNLLELKDECEQIIHSYNFNAEIDFSFEFLDLTINADKALINLVLQNLIYNAIDAIEESENQNGKISIKSLLKENELIIKVFDNGASIKDEKAVFEAFKTTKLKGNGLGLSLCKQIINAHGGQIGFEKEPKCFYFSLPVK
ncbi:two-component sensor histidine kinase [Campylobacter sp. MIT 12-5580]|uniref:sensor histidine kinase n=1 Tax=Campylobacter sp. MIT 12-5580 TaxID=2040651 RepID=UPI0010F7A6FD|nr:HAMP domain-containing sensor histidine kinase [Campylobacter sp. MIT 12-5580]TKX29055.1 two-component sensor histidine kinase [Campylobacter sp. MIT 12-5580]